MNALIGFFARRPLLVNLIMIVVFVMGAATISGMRYEYNPKVDLGRIDVTTARPGAGPEEVELSITLPLEEEILKVEGVKNIYSRSMEGLSLITVQLAPDLDSKPTVINELWQALDRAGPLLPNDLVDEPVLEEQSTLITPVMEVHVTGPVPEETLRRAARRLADGLREVSGIAGVVMLGYRKPELKILVNPEKMARLGMGHGEIVRAVRARNQRDSGGALSSFATEREVVTIGQFRHPEAVRDTVLRAPQPGNVVRLADIAEVSLDYEDWVAQSRIDGELSISLQVRKEARADEMHTAASVRGFVEEARAQMPPGVILKMSNDISRLTVNMLDVLIGNALLGLVAVIALLCYFLRWRFAFWVALGIPFAICLTFLLCAALDVTINAVSITAMILMLGILVDDAVIVGENVQRLRVAGVEPLAASIQGAEQVASPVIFSALTTMLAFAPLLAVNSPDGAFMVDFPLTVLVLLGASLLECLGLLPSHLAHTRSAPTVGVAVHFERLQDAYHRFIARALKRPFWTVAGFVGAFAVVLALGAFGLRWHLYPAVDIDTINVKVEMPLGTSFADTVEAVSALERELRAQVDPQDLLDIASRIGDHDTDLYGASEGRSDAWALININLKPVTQRETVTHELVESLRRWAEERAGKASLSVAAQTDVPVIGQPVEVEIIDNTDARFEPAAELLAWLREQPGVTQSWDSQNPGKDIIDVNLDYGLLAARGLSVERVMRAVRLAMDGMLIDEMQTLDERVRFRLQLAPDRAGRLAALENLVIVNDQGHPVHLGSVARFSLRAGDGDIKHYMGERTVTVFADVDRGAVDIAEINAQVAAFIQERRWAERFPTVRVWQGGELKQTQDTLRGLGRAALICLLGIFAALVILFNSLTQPLLIVLAIPFGVAGVIIGFLLQGMAVGVMAITGIIGLVGVLVNDSLVLVYTMNRRAIEQGAPLDAGQVAAVARQRFRPIVITSLTTVCGLLPTAYGFLGENSYITPMVMAMGWGVMFGGLVSLVLLPNLYLAEQRLRDFLRRLFRRQGARVAA